MDANFTRFHLLLGKADWYPLLTPDLEWDPQTATVTLNKLHFLFRPTTTAADIPLPTRRGAACDQYGNWYMISPTGDSIRLLPQGARETRHWFSTADLAPAKPASAAPGEFEPQAPPPDPKVVTFSGLAVTEDHYLVAGIIEPAGLLVFDLHAGGHPVWLLWPAGVAFEPWDMAPRPGGGVWVLDQTNRRYWGLDRSFRVIGEAGCEKTEQQDDFAPPGQEPPFWEKSIFPAGFEIKVDSPRADFTLAAIEALPDGTVLIMDWRQGHPSDTDPTVTPVPRAPRIYRYRLGKREQSFSFGIPQDQLSPAGSRFVLRGYDLAFVPSPDRRPGQINGLLLVAAADGNQAFSFTLKGPADGLLAAKAEERYFPMRGFGGRGLVRWDGNVYYDYQEQWVPITEQPRSRYAESGQILVRKPGTPGLLDSRKPDCVWHRVLIDACIPPGSSMTVESRAANLETELQDDSIPWQEEPAPYLRTGGAELPYYEPFLPEEVGGGAGTWELLLQRARGRYLQLRITLRSNQRVTPRIRALRVYYDRFSYLREYLPGIYQEEKLSADFLERFLANVEGLYTSLEDRIAQAQMLFDVATVPDEYLDWLAGWLGLSLEAGWDEKRKRLFLRHAPELFQQRGTPAGLVRAIRIATDPCPDDTLFTEDLTLETGGHLGAGDERFRPSTVRIVEGVSGPSAAPHRFSVLVPTRSYGNRREEGVDPALVERIVEMEKPAHTLFDVKEYWAMFRVGDARLGLNTQLDQGSRLSAAVLGNAWLAESYLPYPHPWNVADRMVVGRDRMARRRLPGKGERT